MPDHPEDRAPSGDAPRRPVTVLTVDDQELFRRVMRRLIAATPGFEQVGETDCGARALELAAELRPDLVVVDVRMPGMDGVETARRLVAADAHLAVLLVSLEDPPEPPPSHAAIGFLRKQELSTRALRETWRRRRVATSPTPDGVTTT